MKKTQALGLPTCHLTGQPTGVQPQKERLSLLSSVPHEQCPVPGPEDAGLGATILLGVGEGIVSQM